MEEKLQEESVTLKPELKSSVSTFSADNESGYEDCDPSEANDNIHEPDHTNVAAAKPLETDQEADSLIDITSALTIDSGTRPPSAISFASSTLSLQRRSRSKIPVRTHSSSTITSNSRAGGQSNMLGQAGFPKSEKSKKKRKVSKNLARPLDLWEIQRTLKRGEFVEGVLTVGGGLNGLICAPVTIDRGRLDWRN